MHGKLLLMVELHTFAGHLLLPASVLSKLNSADINMLGRAGGGSESSKPDFYSYKRNLAVEPERNTSESRLSTGSARQHCNSVLGNQFMSKCKGEREANA